MRNVFLLLGLAIIAAIVATLFFLPGEQDPSSQQASPHAIDQSD